MTTELRDYRVAEGHFDDFISAWSRRVAPLRAKHGFRIEGAWASRADRRFLWLLSLDGDQAEFERRNAAYYEDPRRVGLDPDPAQWIEASVHTFIDAVPIGLPDPTP